MGEILIREHEGYICLDTWISDMNNQNDLKTEKPFVSNL